LTVNPAMPVLETIKPPSVPVELAVVRERIKPWSDRNKPFPVEIKPSIEPIKPRADKPSIDVIELEPVLLHSSAVRIKPSAAGYNLATERHVPASGPNRLQEALSVRVDARDR